MENRPLISVVVLCYNQENTIGRTLDSILNQKTKYSYEIIIGEDASPNDNTRAICEDYAAKYSDIIRLLPKESNKGVLKNYSESGRCINRFWRVTPSIGIRAGNSRIWFKVIKIK